MIIDAHAHISGPPELYEHFRELAGRAPGTRPQPIELSDARLQESLADHFAAIDEVGTDMQFVVGRPWSVPTALRNESLVMYIAQQLNNMFARCVNLYPNRFVAMATLPQVAGAGTRLCAEELERCVRELGFIGVKINCDPGQGGLPAPPLSDEYWYPLFEKMVELDVPGLLHGGHYNYSREPELGYYPAEVTVGAWALLRTPRVYRDFPNLKIIVGHGGGYLPYQLGRARVYRAAEMVRDPSLESFDDSLRRLYFDTVLYNPESLELLFKVAGVDRCLFGTDRPASGDVADPTTGRPMNDIKAYIDAMPWLTDADRHAIFEGNARRLFARLPVTAGQA